MEKCMTAIERDTRNPRSHTPDLRVKAHAANVTAGVIDAIYSANA
jgi:hypothetical protein